MREYRRRSLAFSLVELCIVLAIITLGLSILIPATQHAREAARMSQCQSNVRQFGLASIMYVDAFNKLPESRLILDQNQNVLSESIFLQRLRPFLGTDARSSSREGFANCPTNPYQAVFSDGPPVFNHAPAVGTKHYSIDYIGCGGVNSVMSIREIGANSVPSKRRGYVSVLVNEQQSLTMSSLLGGASHTISFWECAMGKSFFRERSSSLAVVDWSSIPLPSLIPGKEFQRAIAIENFETFGKYSLSESGFGMGSIGLLDSLRLPINDAPRPPFRDDIVNLTNQYLGPFSFHASGVNVAYVDGSVRMISKDIDAEVLLPTATVDED